MPSLLTHYLCGDAAVSLIDKKEIKDLINRNRQAFNLGTQGPDIFFYYGAWPWSKIKGYSKIGNIMHEEKTGSFFKNTLLYAKENKNETITAYLMGYLCHYSLDINTHPYIFYRSGFAKEGEEKASKFSCYHRMFETALDILMTKRLLNTTPNKIKAWKLVDVTLSEAAAIGQLYENVLRAVYHLDVNVGQIKGAISDMTGISRALRDRTGLKRKIIGFVEKAANKPCLISSMIHYNKIENDLDYLNLNRAKWYKPWDDSNYYSSTFIEMFEASALEAAKLSTSAYDFLYNSADIKDTLEQIGSRSYSSGIDCALPIKFKYYSCIYEK